MGVRGRLRGLLDTASWRPEAASLILNGRWRRTKPIEIGPDAIAATASWLGRAQDATADGGVSWGYRLNGGWVGSYPETTGYVVPTFLALADVLEDPLMRDRAARAVAFLLDQQAPDGSFPGGTVDRPTGASVFNTGQIINGLTAWYAATQDQASIEAACRAGRWMGSVQDEDGAWRRFGYADYPVTYTAHASCWVGDLGKATGDETFVAIARRHLRWVLDQQDRATGWFERSGFDAASHRRRESVTHTLAYTLWGVLHLGDALTDDAAVAASRRPSLELARLVIREGWLPGVVDSSWEPRSSYACLTGNAQMALVWLRHHVIQPDPALELAARRVLGLVAAAQPRSSQLGLAGGVPGSDPVWGAYIPSALPNWAAKFYIDALLALERSQTGQARPMGPPK